MTIFGNRLVFDIPMVKSKKLLNHMPRTEELWNIDFLVKCIEIVIQNRKLNISTFYDFLACTTNSHILSSFLKMQMLCNARLFKSDIQNLFSAFLQKSYVFDFYDEVKNGNPYVEDYKREIAGDKRLISHPSPSKRIKIDHSEETLPTKSDLGIDSASHEDKKNRLRNRRVKNEDKKVDGNHSTRASNVLETTESVIAQGGEPLEPSRFDEEVESDSRATEHDLIQIFEEKTLLTHDEMIEQLRDTKAALKGLVVGTLNRICTIIDDSFDSTKSMIKSNKNTNTRDLHTAILGRVYLQLEKEITTSLISSEFSNIFTELQYFLSDASGMNKLSNLPEKYKLILQEHLNK